MGKGKPKLRCLAGQDSFKEKASVLALLSAAVVADAAQCHTSESLELVYSVKTSLSNRKKKSTFKVSDSCERTKKQSLPFLLISA